MFNKNIIESYAQKLCEKYIYNNNNIIFDYKNINYKFNLYLNAKIIKNYNIYYYIFMDSYKYNKYNQIIKFKNFDKNKEIDEPRLPFLNYIKHDIIIFKHMSKMTKLSKMNKMFKICKLNNIYKVIYYKIKIHKSELLILYNFNIDKIKIFFNIYYINYYIYIKIKDRVFNIRFNCLFNNKNDIILI